MRTFIGLVALIFALSAAPPADAGDGRGSGDSSLQSVTYEVQHSGEQAALGVVVAGSNNSTYEIRPACGLSARYICYEQAVCADGGTLFNVFRDGFNVGQTCLTETEASDEAVITPGQVLRAFRSLDWPASELLVEPPGGETLVNFATNFHTDNDQPLRQSVTLLGRRVTIEATPTTYAWHFGDGTSSATDRPGSAYPDLDIVHAYLTTGTLAPSVDTTYTGRYRIGGGPWVTIPDTLTVAGSSETLTIREARPTLVKP